MRFRIAAALVLCGLLLAGCETEDDPGLIHFPTQVVTRPAPTLSAASGLAPTGQPSLPTLTPLPYPQISARAPHVVVGQSVEGRPISSWQFGSGPAQIVLIGGIHGGYEYNTVLLAEMLIDHFDQNPEDVLPGVQLSIIPLANPDGIARGGGLEGRLNARGVDLNRNWDCDWSQQAIWGTTPVNAGAAPFSEPESQALRAYLESQHPDVVVFYHSAAGIVAVGDCDGQSPGADWLPKLLSDATGYPVHRFDYYEVTGDASNWLAKEGLPSVVIELSSKDEPEFQRNLLGVIALECHLARQEVPDAGHDPSLQRLCA